MSQVATTEGSPPAESDLGQEIRRNFSLIIPAFNERENIEELFKALKLAFERFALHGEIIFVDDGSTDGTFDLAKREGRKLDRFKLKRHRRNLGKTEALLTGSEDATADWLILFDADLQHLPDAIPRLLREAEKGYDIVCARKVGKYRKRVVSTVYNWLSRKAFRVPVRDLNSLKIFRKEILDEIHLRHDWHRFFVVLAHARGFRVGEVDVPLYPRRGGSSKYRGGGRVFVGVLDLLAVWFQLFFSRKPMLLFGFPGLALLGLGVLVGIGAFVLRFMGHGFRPLLDLVVLLVVVGISLFCFAFVAEMVATLRSEVDELREIVRKLKAQR